VAIVAAAAAAAVVVMLMLLALVLRQVRVWSLRRRVRVEIHVRFCNWQAPHVVFRELQAQGRGSNCHW
jgi:hypothetical protein